MGGCQGIETLWSRVATETLIGGAYRYAEYKTGTRKPKGGLARCAFLCADAKSTGLKKAIQAGTAVAESVNIARDLVNAPPNDLNPVTLAEFAKTEAEKLNLEVDVWDKKKIEAAGMNLFLAVNRGSAVEPRFIHIAYKPKKSHTKVLCAIFYGVIPTTDVDGVSVQEVQAIHSGKTSPKRSITTTVLPSWREHINWSWRDTTGAKTGMLSRFLVPPITVTDVVIKLPSWRLMNI